MRYWEFPTWDLAKHRGMDPHQPAGADVLQLMPRWKRPETPLAGDRQVFRPPSWIGRARDLGSLPPARHTIGSRIEVPRGDFRTRSIAAGNLNTNDPAPNQVLWLEPRCPQEKNNGNRVYHEFHCRPEQTAAAYMGDGVLVYLAYPASFFGLAKL